MCLSAMDRYKNIFDSPQIMSNTIGKLTKVQTIDKKIHEGIVYIIDPLSKTVILTNEACDNLEIITFHAIDGILQLSESPIKTFKFQNSVTATHTARNSEETKESLKKWLKQNHLKVTEQDSVICVEDQVTIEAPYGIEQCFCSSTVVLERIQDMISNLPH